jgi:hypothetical protein
VGRSFRLSRLAQCDTLEIDRGTPHAIVIRTPSPTKVLPHGPLEAEYKASIASGKSLPKPVLTCVKGKSDF